MYLSILKAALCDYKKFLINKRINDIVMVNSRLFLFYFKKEKKQLIVDLDNNNPYIGLLETNYNELSLPNDFLARLNSKGHPLINDIKIVNDDKIIDLIVKTSDAYYHQNEYHLYIELITGHANMILADKNNRIITAFFESGINSPRLIVKNGIYKFPSKKEEKNIDVKYDKNEYQKFVIDSFNKGLMKRKKEIYGVYIKKIEKKVKSLDNKIKKIECSKEKAKHELEFKEYGEIILMNQNQIKRGDASFENIKLDISKDAVNNANAYFNKYKKAKRTLETIDIYLDQAKKEKEENEFYLEFINNADLNEIKSLFDNNKSKRNKDNEKSYMPYFISYKNVRYYYGHNAIENDYLTFKMFAKNSEVIWCHLKDQPGAHLIINKKEATNEELNIASNLLLFLNQQITGEIMYTERKNVTRGTSLAKANVINYKTITIHKCDENMRELLKREKRANG